MRSLPISVVLPFFNGAAYIQGALASILQQSVLPIEIIVINDGSTSEAAAELHEAISQNGTKVPIRVIEQENAGQSASRNRGVAIAEGELIAFLDQDDEWHPEHLRRLSAPFESRTDLGWAYCDFDEIDGRGGVVTRRFMHVHKIHHPKLSIAEILGNDLMILPSASIIRKTAPEQAGGFESRLRGYEDDDLFIRVFQSGWTSEFLKDSLTSFRVHQGSSSDNSSFRRSRMVFFQKVAEKFPDDHRLNRFYVTDLIVPRLLNSTLNEYSSALQARQFEEARSIADSIKTLIAGRDRVGLGARLGIAVLHRPRLCRSILRFRQALPRFLRPPVRPALTLRS